MHVFLQLFLSYSLNIDIRQISVMPLKANEDARVKRKDCNTDIEGEITGSNAVPYRVALPHSRWRQNVLSVLCGVLFWMIFNIQIEFKKKVFSINVFQV